MKYASVSFLFLIFCFGCGKKPEPPVLRMFCCETYWTVMKEETALFAGVYGVRIRLLPIGVVNAVEPAPQESETASKRRSPAPWRTRPTEQQTLIPGKVTLNVQIRELITSITDRARYGDMYLTDSSKQAELLREGAAVAVEYPFCVLTLTLLVAKDNPLQVDSVNSLLDANRRLGIVEPSLDGMGETAFHLISKYLRVSGEGRFDGRIVLFDKHVNLLAALRNQEVDAALVWEPLALEAAEFAEVIELPAEERLAVRQPLLALSMAANQAYAKRFADFLISPRGREILRIHGFTPSK